MTAAPGPAIGEVVDASAIREGDMIELIGGLVAGVDAVRRVDATVVLTYVVAGAEVTVHLGRTTPVRRLAVGTRP